MSDLQISITCTARDVFTGVCLKYLSLWEILDMNHFSSATNVIIHVLSSFHTSLFGLAPEVLHAVTARVGIVL